MKTASDFYLAFLPLLNAGRVELLDSPRLVNQLAALERRRGRGGRDTVDHAPGGHDDAACAAAGALTLAAIDGAPSLVRRQDVEPEADQDIVPRLVSAIVGVLVIAPDGRVGWALFAAPPPGLRDVPLWVLDFGAPRLSPEMFDDMAAAMDERAEHFREAKRNKGPVHVLAFAPSPYDRTLHAAMRRVFERHYERLELRTVSCHSLEDSVDRMLLADPVRLHFTAGAHFAEGRVKFSATARERLATLPIGITGPLGDAQDPVTQAIWLSVVLQFERQSGDPDPGWPGAQLVHA